MSPEEHNKYVGYANIAYGAIHIILMVVVGVVVGVMMGLASQNSRRDAPPLAVFGIVIVLVVGINLLLAIPSFIAGYAFLKRKPWAKVAGIVASVLAALRIPFGTAVSIYTFWFLFSEPGRVLYDKQAQALPPMPPNWANVDQKIGSDVQYVPPTTPPDWRS
jgi:hypothetical protein